MQGTFFVCVPFIVRTGMDTSLIAVWLCLTCGSGFVEASQVLILASILLLSTSVNILTFITSPYADICLDTFVAFVRAKLRRHSTSLVARPSCRATAPPSLGRPLIPHALLAHVAERHRRAGWCFGFTSSVSLRQQTAFPKTLTSSRHTPAPSGKSRR